ncbi:hypothetical protein [Desulfoluna spongiiphila]|uniref:Uncharacterized protein n=1 Tax=Desulfoluna spongiiphila TaxID=419481 RepID=A0A1G5DIY5_9BACT|nr:hypothetical protein [Desulfoluna spongiiphila]SCY14703.1 hypothetical protein SAMN05216233_104220 [Desulfoluna spongiiphila]
MNAQVEKSYDNKNRTAANSVGKKKCNRKQGLGFVDNRFESIAQRKLQDMVNISTQKNKHENGPSSSSIKNEIAQLMVKKNLEKDTPVLVKELNRVYYVYDEIEGFGYTVSAVPSGKKGPLYMYEMLDNYEISGDKLQTLSELPQTPSRYIRINSFAFAKSGKLPIASHSYMTCMGVIVHDNSRKMGGLAHIDTDAQEKIKDKTVLINKSVYAMLKSIKPQRKEDLEVSVFAGLGLIGKDKDFTEFVSGFTGFLKQFGVGSNQIHFNLNKKQFAKMAIYFPEQGSVYFDGTSETSVIDKGAMKRINYGDDDYTIDYEDQEEKKDEVGEGNTIIFEIEFDEQGNEVAHTNHKENYAHSPGIMGSEPITSFREPVQRKKSALQPSNRTLQFKEYQGREGDFEQPRPQESSGFINSQETIETFTQLKGVNQNMQPAGNAVIQRTEIDAIKYVDSKGLWHGRPKTGNWLIVLLAELRLSGNSEYNNVYSRLTQNLPDKPLLGTEGYDPPTLFEVEAALDDEIARQRANKIEQYFSDSSHYTFTFNHVRASKSDATERCRDRLKTGKTSGNTVLLLTTSEKNAVLNTLKTARSQNWDYIYIDCAEAIQGGMYGIQRLREVKVKVSLNDQYQLRHLHGEDLIFKYSDNMIS